MLFYLGFYRVLLKKLLKITFILSIVSAAAFISYRYIKNPISEVPRPYIFKDNVYKPNTSNAPILIIGDRLGTRLSKYKKLMADTISTNLSKKVEIISMAMDGEGIHRTLERIKKIGKLPLITIYIGGSEETFEQRFSTKDINKILFNFNLYSDERIKTLLMVFPIFSKFIYKVINHQRLGETIKEDTNKYSDLVIQKRNIIHFKLYDESINDLFSYIKEHGSYLIALTQPLNLDVPPKKSCDGSLDELSREKIIEVTKRIKDKDYKGAYSISKDLILFANTNAKVHYLHGKITKKLGLMKEANNALELAIAYDCVQWRGNPVYNRMLVKAARNNDVLVLDFNKLVLKEWGYNTIFSDEIYPQNLYFERVTEALSFRIKKLLKL
jgi:hypothetical protein